MKYALVVINGRYEIIPVKSAEEQAILLEQLGCTVIDFCKSAEEVAFTLVRLHLLKPL